MAKEDLSPGITFGEGLFFQLLEKTNKNPYQNRHVLRFRVGWVFWKEPFLSHLETSNSPYMAQRRICWSNRKRWRSRYLAALFFDFFPAQDWRNRHRTINTSPLLFCLFFLRYQYQVKRQSIYDSIYLWNGDSFSHYIYLQYFCTSEVVQDWIGREWSATQANQVTKIQHISPICVATYRNLQFNKVNSKHTVTGSNGSIDSIFHNAHIIKIYNHI